MGDNQRYVIDEDDDDDNNDVYMYPTDMHPDERDHKTGELSRLSDAPRPMRKSQSYFTTRRRNIKDLFKGGSIKETMGRLISKFFIYESVAPYKANSHHFKNMIISAQQVGMAIEPPSPYEIKNKYLEMEYVEMEAYVNQQREKWKTYGCTIMSDGWTGPTKLNSEVVPTMPFVYELMQVMKENLIRQQAREWMFEIIKGCWEKTLKHPLHAVAYFLNPRFQYRHGVGSDPELLQTIHDVFMKLDPTAKTFSQFGNEDNQLFQWVRPLHLDDEIGNPDPWIVAHAREFGVDVDQVLSKEVHSESFSKDTDDSFEATLNSHPSVDSTSVRQSSRPSVASTSASSYDGSRGGTDDGGDNAGGDVGQQQQSQYPMSPFTYEDDFTHCTQDEDHGSRRAGPSIGAIGKSYRGRE
ncbi:hypothetical protein AAG906_021463 [Vitis piasezkii]